METAAYAYLLVGLVIAALLWHGFHDPRTLREAAKQPEFANDTVYRCAVAAICALAVLAWPLIAAWVAVKTRPR